MADQSTPFRATPLCIGPRNAAAVTGHDWRWWRDHAQELGLTIVRIGGKSMISAEEVARVLERQAAEQHTEPELTVEQKTDRLLAECGYRAVRGAAAK